MNIQVLDIKMISDDSGPGCFSKIVLKQKEVPGYDSDNYRCRRVFAPSLSSSGCKSDVMIPISLVYHKSLVQSSGNGESRLPFKAPLLMCGYGDEFKSCIKAKIAVTMLTIALNFRVLWVQQ